MENLQLDFNYIQEEEKINIEEHYGLIGFVLSKKKLKKLYEGKFEYEELFQMGVIHLIKAVEKYDFKRGIKFSTYAVSELYYGIMNDLLRDKWFYYRKANSERKGYSTFESIALTSLNEEVRTGKEGGKAIEKMECIEDKKNRNEEVEGSLFFKQAISGLEERDKHIFELFYKHNKSQTEIANIMQLSQVTIGRRLKKGLKKIRNEMGVSI